MLAQLHSLMLRYHNRHARELAKVNPTWSDEKLFTEARRLNIAIHQHIVFEDYLPLLMGNITLNIGKLNFSEYYKRLKSLI